jgi:hypothetical protein
MAADDETQDAVRRILKERPPEKLPSRSEARLRQRLDEEQAARAVTRPARPARKTVQRKKRTAAR